MSDTPAEGTREWWMERRREQILTAGHYRRVRCPLSTCQAQIGEDCRSEAWHIIKPFHSARRKLANMTEAEREAWARDSYG